MNKGTKIGFVYVRANSILTESSGMSWPEGSVALQRKGRTVGYLYVRNGSPAVGTRVAWPDGAYTVVYAGPGHDDRLDGDDRIDPHAALLEEIRRADDTARTDSEFRAAIAAIYDRHMESY